jgi:hypothetical protein
MDNKIVARRRSDGLVSKTSFNFDIVPHDFYSTCIFCEIDPDKQDLGHANIAPMRDVARPGLKKRQMSGTEVRDFSDKPDDNIEDSCCLLARNKKNNDSLVLPALVVQVSAQAMMENNTWLEPLVAHDLTLRHRKVKGMD